MLKNQSKDLEEMIKDQGSNRSENTQEESKLLQEPAIISSSQTLDAPQASLSASLDSSTLVQAKVKPIDEAPKLKLEDIEKKIKSGDQAEKDKITKLVKPRICGDTSLETTVCCDIDQCKCSNSVRKRVQFYPNLSQF